MRILVLLVILLSSVICNGQTGEHIVKKFLKDFKSDKSNDQILNSYILDYDKKDNQDKEFLKMGLESLRERTRSVELDKIKISQPDKKNFTHGDSSLNPEIYEVIIQNGESRYSFFVLYEQKKIKSFVVMNNTCKIFLGLMVKSVKFF